MCQICEFLDDPHRAHHHTIMSAEIPAHDQGAAYFHRQDATMRFWAKVREIVREEITAALDERDKRAWVDRPE